MIKKLALGVGAVFAPVLAFAEGEGSSFSINSAFSDMDMSSLVTELGSTLFTGLTAAIGLAAGCWGITLIWRKIKGAVR